MHKRLLQVDTNKQMSYPILSDNILQLMQITETICERKKHKENIFEICLALGT